MNRFYRTAIMAAVAMLLTAGTLQAQEPTAPAQEKGNEKQGATCQHNQKEQLDGPFANYLQIPGLTEKQAEAIKKIRLEMLKEVMEFHDQIMEKEARLRTLTRTDRPDTRAIDKVIDEIAVLEASARKRVEKARQLIREQLDAEQKLWFDQNCQGHSKGHNKQEKKHKESCKGHDGQQQHKGCNHPKG